MKNSRTLRGLLLGSVLMNLTMLAGAQGSVVQQDHTLMTRIAAILHNKPAISAPSALDNPITAAPTALTPIVMKRERTLIFSDSPEYVGKRTGILAQGTVEPGPGRVYFYHVNESREPRRMVLYVENLSFRPGMVMIQEAMKAGPSPSYFEVGRALSKAELERQPDPHQALFVGGYGQEQLWPAVSQVLIPSDALFTGLVDFYTDVPIRVSVAMVPADYDTKKSLLRLPILPFTDGHLRGTFQGAERTIEVDPFYDPSQGGAYVELSNGREDPFELGVDETLTPKQEKYISQNTGNYGIRETVTVHTLPMGDFHLYFQPLGGAYAGYVRVSAGEASEIISIPPTDQPHMGDGTIYSSQLLGTYHGGTTLTIEFMPAGASNLPVRFVFIPVEKS